MREFFGDSQLPNSWIAIDVDKGHGFYFCSGLAKSKFKCNREDLRKGSNK